MFFKRIVAALMMAFLVSALFIGAPQVTSAVSATPSAIVDSVQAQIPPTSAVSTMPSVTVDSVQAQIPRKCLRYTKGRTICAYKPSSQKIGKTFAMENGKVVGWIVNYNIHSRFGGWIDGADHRTPSDTFPIHYFVKDAKSNIYNGVPMPYYIKFRSDGVGIHYSRDYDVFGRTTSHGCVGLKSKAYAKRLFNWAQERKPWPRVVTVVNY